jgi:hypothetical protein
LASGLNKEETGTVSDGIVTVPSAATLTTGVGGLAEVACALARQEALAPTRRQRTQNGFTEPITVPMLKHKCCSENLFISLFPLIHIRPLVCVLSENSIAG